MGYPETMRDVLEQVKREELQAENVARSIHKRLEKEKMENITIYAGVVECAYHELTEEFIKSASDALSMRKKESKGK